MKALVLDDRGTIRDILGRQLRGMGFRVQLAATGAEAAAAMERAAFDLALIDWRTVGAGGVKFPLPLGRVPTIAMTTAYDAEEVYREAREAGIEWFLVKPVSQSSLVDTVMSVFGRGGAAGAAAARSVDPVEIVQPIRGARILLAEDNEMNQQVAMELLGEAGFLVTLATDGKQAVEMMRADFHAVLMDVQMPTMNGYEATRLIRANPAFDGIPVIAMTANAMEQDRQQALQAGMVDHVAKPIDTAELFGKLLRHIVPDPAKPFAPPGAAPASSAAASVAVELPASLPGVDIAAGLGHLAGNRAAYRRFLLQFGRDNRLAADIRSALQAGDRPAAVRAAHSLKSVAGNLGADELSRAAAAAEAALKAGTETADSVRGLDEAFAEVAGGIRAWASRATTAAGVTVQTLEGAGLRQALEQLRALIADNDAAAIERWEDLASRLSPETRSALGGVHQALSAFDFEAAKAGIDKQLGSPGG
jgi:two-component system, sensor histidine kinase and response regulator